MTEVRMCVAVHEIAREENRFARKRSQRDQKPSAGGWAQRHHRSPHAMQWP